MLTLTVVAAMMIGARVQGEDAAPTSTTIPAANPPPAQTTVVEGTAPAIEGRWLLLASLGVAQGAKRIIPRKLFGSRAAALCARPSPTPPSSTCPSPIPL